MAEAISAVIVAVLKIGVPIYIAALIASGFLLFAPDSLANTLGLINFRLANREYLGFVFVASLSLLVAYSLTTLVGSIGERIDDWRMRRRIFKALRDLTEPEKEFLRPFIRNGENTQYAPISDGITGGLVSKHFIYRSSNIIERMMSPYNLQPPVRRILEDHPHLLD